MHFATNMGRLKPPGQWKPRQEVTSIRSIHRSQSAEADVQHAHLCEIAWRLALRLLNVQNFMRCVALIPG